MSKTTIEYVDSSEEVLDELVKLMKSSVADSLKIIADEAKARVTKWTGKLAEGITYDNEEQVTVSDDYTSVYGDVGYLSRKSYETQHGKGGFYPNPHWVEFGTKAHTVQTKQLKREEEKLTYQLTDLSGNTYGFEVEHPGAQNRNFLLNAERNKINEASSKLIEGITNIENYEIKHIKDKTITITKE